MVVESDVFVRQQAMVLIVKPRLFVQTLISLFQIVAFSHKGIKVDCTGLATLAVFVPHIFDFFDLKVFGASINVSELLSFAAVSQVFDSFGLDVMSKKSKCLEFR